MLAADSFSCVTGLAALERSLMALTQLRELHLGGSQMSQSLHLGTEGGSVLARSLKALTLLQTLNLSSKTQLHVMWLCTCVIFQKRNGVLLSLTRVSAGGNLNAEGCAAMGRSLTTLVALQTLDLSGTVQVL